jgi:hypothetical protein
MVPVYTATTATATTTHQTIPRPARPLQSFRIMRSSVTFMTTVGLILITGALPFAACHRGTDDAPPADGQAPDAQVPDAGPDAAPPLDPNTALVFLIDPVATPEATDVVLAGVADDAGGSLTSTADASGVRRLRVLSCLDEGDTIQIPGSGPSRICTLRPRANKDEHGSFVYPDWDADVTGDGSPDDVHAEVSLYYHAQRMYDLLTAPEVGVFPLLPGRHWVDGEPVPLNLVANYRLPAPASATELAPAGVAFFIPSEWMQMGMSTFQGLQGYDGDFLVFGQGGRTDFGYDGDTVYHEFGHAVTWATAQLESMAPDALGLTHLGGAVDEGLADTFAFLVSGNPRLYAYLDARTGGGFGVDVDEDFLYPQDLHGLQVADGRILASANRAVLQLLADRAGIDVAGFTRLVLLTLERLAARPLWSSLAPWSDALLAVLADEGLDTLVPDVRDLLHSRGLGEVERAVDVTSWTGTSDQFLVTGGAIDEPWNTYLEVEDASGWVRISPATVQLVVVPPAGADQVVLDAVIHPWGNSFPATVDDLDYRLYVHAGSPVTYTATTGQRVVVDRDTTLVPTVGPGANSASISFTVTGLTPGTPTYLHLVNYGDAAGGVSLINCGWP